jgi:hypothetical protein
MRTIALVLFALVALAAAHNVRKTVPPGLAKVASHKWGKNFLTLAALQVAAKGPLETFWGAVDDLENDLKEQLDSENDEWNERSVNHQATALDLQTSVNDAEFDIAAATQRIDNVLVPSKNDLEAELEKDTASIDQNREQIDRETAARNSEHERWKQLDREHTEAIDAIDEAIELGEQLVADAGSFVQIKKAHNKIKVIQTKLEKISLHDVPLAAALIAIASEGFDDQQDFRQVVSLLNDLRAKIVASQNELEQEEEAEQESFKERVGLLEREVSEWQVNINANTVTLSNTNTLIDEEEEFRAGRESDLDSYNSQLQLENESYRQLGLIHEEVVSELLEEIDVVQELRSILNNESFNDYINRILDTDYVWEASPEDE